MILIDTHTHLYLEEFDSDRKLVIERSIKAGVTQMLLPNIDYSTINPMLSLSVDYANICFPMFGLHPGSVKENYENELSSIFEVFAQNTNTCCAIGEIGIDLYWDKTFSSEQKIAFREQIRIAKKYNYPLVIHNRNAFEEIYEILHDEYNSSLTGVFHCFSGSIEMAQRIIKLGFKLGIGGVVTYKNSKLPEVIREIDLENIVLETDSPFLTPQLYRGSRNESSYLGEICNKVAEIKSIHSEEVARVTTENSRSLFRIK